MDLAAVEAVAALLTWQGCPQWAQPRAWLCRSERAEPPVVWWGGSLASA